MNSTRKRFFLPQDDSKFRQTMKPVEGCEIISSKTSEDIEGPEVEEVYRCPCGDIMLNQKSIITNVDNPEDGNIEVIHMKSDGCAL